MLIVLFLSLVDLRTLNSYSELIEKEDYKGVLMYIYLVYFFFAVSSDFYVKALLILSRAGFNSVLEVHLISFFVDMHAIIAISPFATIVAQKALVAETALGSFSASWLTEPFDYESCRSFDILLLNCLS